MKSIRIEVLKKFRNPLTQQRTTVGEEFHVSKNGFWLKRILEKDCKQIPLRKKEKSKPKVKPVSVREKGSK